MEELESHIVSVPVHKTQAQHIQHQRDSQHVDSKRMYS